MPYGSSYTYGPGGGATLNANVPPLPSPQAINPSEWENLIARIAQRRLQDEEANRLNGPGGGGLGPRRTPSPFGMASTASATGVTNDGGMSGWDQKAAQDARVQQMQQEGDERQFREFNFRPPTKLVGTGMNQNPGFIQDTTLLPISMRPKTANMLPSAPLPSAQDDLNNQRLADAQIANARSGGQPQGQQQAPSLSVVTGAPEVQPQQQSQGTDMFSTEALLREISKRRAQAGNR